MTLDPRFVRLAGVFYLTIIALGLFGEFFVRSGLVVPGDAGQTAENIRAAEGLFRAGLMADLAMLSADVALAVLLFLLLRPVSLVIALLATAFRLMMDAVLGANLLLLVAALLLLGDGSQGVTAPEPLALLALVAQSYGYDLGLFFFGICCLLTGWLIARSVYVPRLLGAGLMAAGLVYLIGSLARVLAPEVVSLLVPLYAIPLVVELSLALWLTFRGGRIGAPSGMRV